MCGRISSKQNRKERKKHGAVEFQANKIGKKKETRCKTFMHVLYIDFFFFFVDNHVLYVDICYPFFTYILT